MALTGIVGSVNPFGMMRMRLEFIDSLLAIKAQDWNRLAGTAYPFLRHEFLLALEQSGCAAAASGWTPHHLVVFDDEVAPNTLVGFMPCYLKDHSYGEYIFDWAWAQAYHRYGLNYYPKLMSAIPFTPAQGPRMVFAPHLDVDALRLAVIQGLTTQTRSHEWSSWHCLLPTDAVLADLSQEGSDIFPDIYPRLNCQFHWFNRGYTSFDDFLGQFRAKKRKNLKQERRKITDQGISLHRIEGADITDQHWRTFYQCYTLTYAKRGMPPYLNLAFFQQIHQTMSEHCLLIVAKDRFGDTIACAFCIIGEDTLYGRYWGALQEIDCLHFETCFYQGIEYCIERGLTRYDPGAQGEHKILRGFEPIGVHSIHYLADERFRYPIKDFLNTERQRSLHYIRSAQTLLPFKD